MTDVKDAVKRLRASLSSFDLLRCTVPKDDIRAVLAHLETVERELRIAKEVLEHCCAMEVFRMSLEAGGFEERFGGPNDK